jgi:hypothetical protein
MTPIFALPQLRNYLSVFQSFSNQVGDPNPSLRFREIAYVFRAVDSEATRRLVRRGADGG